MVKRKLVFVMIDGIGDVTAASLGNKTPLQHAATPTFDRLSELGLNGLMDPVEPGLACGSDTAHLSILGYDPRIYYRGRGAFESMGAGLEMVPGDIAFKSNFATLDRNTNIVLRRRADRNFEDIGPELCDFLTGSKLPSFPEYQVDVKYATEHRCGVRVRGPGLSGNISGTDPLKDEKLLVNCIPLDDSEESIRTAKLTNELSQVISDRLSSHPINQKRLEAGKPVANVVLLRGCGVRISVPTFEERHQLKAFMIAPTCIIAGLGISIGIDVKEVEGATGDYHTNLDAKAEAIYQNITTPAYDFGFFHIKAVDDAGHDGNMSIKLDFLQRIDAVVGRLIERLVADQIASNGETEYSVVITGDHSTPVSVLDHCYEPVPFVICKLKRWPSFSSSSASPTPSPLQALECADKVTQYSEIDAAAGILGRFPGSQVMTIIKRYAYDRI